MYGFKSIMDMIIKKVNECVKRSIEIIYSEEQRIKY